MADISGYSAYLSKVELDHANAILSELLETIIARLKSLLSIVKLEGDAVCAYLPHDAQTRSETLLELIETTYAAFSDQLTTAKRNTTCTCRACSAIPSLDLKFILHFGEYLTQNVAGIQELIGSEVNLAHRLLKNQVVEKTGWRAYVLLSQPAVDRLGISTSSMHSWEESYEHLGSVQVFTYNLRERYEALVDSRQDIVTPVQAYAVTTHIYTASPAVIWDWLNDPRKRSQYTPQAGLVFTLNGLINGRTGVGAQTHCVHNDKTAMVETVLDWRPFEYFTVEQRVPPGTMKVTYKLEPLPDGGTHLTVYERGRILGIEFLDRPIVRLLVEKVVPTSKYLSSLEEHLQAASQNTDSR